MLSTAARIFRTLSMSSQTHRHEPTAETVPFDDPALWMAPRISAFSTGGIRTTAIAPGFTHTKITDAVVKDEARYGKSLERIPLGCWANPDDFKGLSIMLASHAGDYLNGITIVVDGGMLSRLT